MHVKWNNKNKQGNNMDTKTNRVRLTKRTQDSNGEKERERAMERCSEHAPDGLHHARVAQLPSAEFAVEIKCLLKLVWLDAADKEGLALAESGHEAVERFLELDAKRLRLLASVCSLERGRERKREGGGGRE